jgi:AcrR family transcriptional regulator
MTVTRPYRSPARKARSQQTRRAIVDAFIAQLGDPGRATLSPAAAARAAGVSIRTVHHYFPDAEAQLAAVAAEVETRLFPRPAPLPRTPAELPDLVTAVYRAAEGQLPLLRAMVNSGVGTEVRRRRRAQRLQAIQHALAGIGASEAETRRGVAVVSMLASADAWPTSTGSPSRRPAPPAPRPPGPSSRTSPRRRPEKLVRKAGGDVIEKAGGDVIELPPAIEDR